MPIREYQCLTCNYKFERLELSGKNDFPIECQKCHSKEIKRIISSCSFRLKGTGWNNSRSGKTLDHAKKLL